VTASAPKTSPKSAPKPASWAYAEDYVEETDAAAAARLEAAELGVSPLGRGCASTLTLLARAISAKAVVEIGTGSGVSGLALFAGMQPDGVLTSVDIEAEHQHAARKAFVSVGIPNQRFDLVFIDADKSEYPDYVEEGLRLLRHGGLLAVDNALWHDRTADPAQNDEQTEAIRSAVNAVKENDDLVAALLPVGDGLLVAVKR
jgi:predicted O-methyltransferase YrrM